MKTVVEVDEMDERYRSAGGQTPDENGQTRRLELSLIQIVGGALAAAAAAVAASALGVYGTVIGAAVISVVATVVTAVTTSSLHRGRQVIQYGVRRTPRPDPAPNKWKTLLARPKQWAVVGASSAATLALALAVLTGFELVSGSSASDLTSGRDTGSRTTLGSLTTKGADSQPRPKTTEPDAGTDSTDGSTTSDTPEPESNGIGENPRPTAEPSEQPTKPTTEPTAEPTEPETTEPEPEPEPEPTTEPTTPPPPTPGVEPGLDQ